jgi:hypothetical protein
MAGYFPFLEVVFTFSGYSCSAVAQDIATLTATGTWLIWPMPNKGNRLSEVGILVIDVRHKFAM